jgi:hypothetical protein
LKYSTFILLLLLLAPAARTQPDLHPEIAPGPGFYVRLKNGQTLYSSFVRLRHPTPAEKYLALDNNQQIPIEKVHRYKSSYGTFVTVPGSSGTDIYRAEREGPRISLYSGLAKEPSALDDRTPTRSLFFRKTGETIMTPLALPCLKQAMADNPSSLHQLQTATRLKYTGLAILLTSAIVEGFGISQSFRKRAATVPPPPIMYRAPPQHYFSASPLLYIGGGGLIAGFVLVLSGHRHFKRTFEIYNQ